MLEQNIIEYVNEIGEDEFGCSRVIGVVNRARVVEVYSKRTKEKKKVYLNNLKRGHKPKFKKASLLILKEEVNKIGNGFFLFNKVEKNKNTDLVVSVKCLETNEIKKARVKDLRAGKNPFETNLLKEIHILHPIIEKMLKKNNLSYRKEFCITKKSRVDFYVENKAGEVYLIEVKDDCLYQTRGQIKAQVKRYRNAAKRKIKNYKKTFLCSPSGKVGLSFEKLEEVLKKIS